MILLLIIQLMHQIKEKLRENMAKVKHICIYLQIFMFYELLFKVIDYQYQYFDYR